jgi:rubredoxin
VDRVSVGGWRGHATCPDEHLVEVAFTLADYGDAPALYQCPQCSDLIAVDPQAEQYIGPEWDQMRDGLICPSCGDGLGHAWLYPDHFRCPECGGVGTFDLPDSYPPDDMRVAVSCWNPYAEAD